MSKAPRLSGTAGGRISDLHWSCAAKSSGSTMSSLSYSRSSSASLSWSGPTDNSIGGEAPNIVSAGTPRTQPRRNAIDPVAF